MARGKGTASVYVSLEFRGETYTDYVDVCVDPYETTLAEEIKGTDYKSEDGKIYIQCPYEYFGRKYKPDVYFETSAMLMCDLPDEEYKRYSELLVSQMDFEIIDATASAYVRSNYALNYKGETDITPEISKEYSEKDKFHIGKTKTGTTLAYLLWKMKNQSKVVNNNGKR